ncbi:MAG TPA: 2-succinyl-5-enolpyruvyl-6-hydroxy-3-cyclohexene-1-carboxylic-acid synthase, partial [Acidimicrobiales bacterium]
MIVRTGDSAPDSRRGKGACSDGSISETEPLAAADVQATFCATLADEWARGGVTDVVVAPGSRSTPLALAMAADDRLRVHVHHDERSAGFMALGLGLESGRPAVVVCTSGTAAVELHPAVVEAHQARVPLIVATADRPPELQGVGAPQTINQVNLYGASVRWFVAPGVADAVSSATWRALAARAVAEATSGPTGPGPVHLNLAFREPLVGRPGPLPAGRPDGQPWHSTGGQRVAVDRLGVARLEELLDAGPGVIVAGAGCGDPAAVLDLAAAVGWPVIADHRSGCRIPHSHVVASADALLRHESFADAHRPAVVLRLGQPPASKVLGQWLAASGAVQVAIAEHGAWFDPDHTAAHVSWADPTAACTALARTLTPAEPSWAAGWVRAEAAAQAAFDAVLTEHEEITEPGLARRLLASIPDGSTVVVSSSMPVRDVEWFGAPRAGVRVLANRGANGIDGVTSTAVGVALANAAAGGDPTFLLTGDVAFLHDTNGLLGAAARGI